MRYSMMVAVASALMAVSAAAESPIQISLYSPAQIVGPEDSVKGLRLSLIFGENANVSGVDLGLVIKTTGDQVGLQSGAVVLVDGNFKGLQDGIYNSVKGAFFLALPTAS